MTIALSANTPRVSYTVSQGATQTSFAVPFVFFTDSTDLNVFVDNVARTYDASTSNTSLFTVSGGNGSTGTVTTTVTGATGGSTVVITRAVPLSRTTDFPSSGAFEVSKLNTELDTITAIQSDFNDSASRAVRLKDSDSAVSMELPLLDARKGTVLGFNATTGAVEAGPTIANVSSLADITANINTVAGISANVTTVAGISSNVTTVAGIASNVTTLAASDVVADMALLADSAVIADMALLGNADVIADMALLANSDVIADMNTLATSDIVSDLNTLATSDIVTDLNILATSDNVTNMATLGASGVVANIATVAGVASNVTTVAGVASNVTTVAGISSNVTTVAGISSNVTTVAGDTTNIGTIATDLSGTDTIGTVAGSISNVNSVAGAITNINTVATNISGVNSFAERYRVASSDPSSNNDEGDLVYNTTDNNLKFFNGSSFVSIGGAISNIVEDTTPQLGGNLDVNGNSIVSASGGNISITPDGSGKVIIDGLSHPTSDGSAGQFLKTDGAGTLTFATVNTQAFPSGTSMLFQQTAAPTGWTKQTTHNDKALRVVTGTVGTGGSVAFSTALGSGATVAGGSVSGNPTSNLAVDAGNLAVSISGNVSSHTLSVNEIPSHTHGYISPLSGSGTMSGPGGSNAVAFPSNATTNSTGGGGSHNHGHNISGNISGAPSLSGNVTAGNLAVGASTAAINVNYVDVIIANHD